MLAPTAGDGNVLSSRNGPRSRGVDRSAVAARCTMGVKALFDLTGQGRARDGRLARTGPLARRGAGRDGRARRHHRAQARRTRRRVRAPRAGRHRVPRGGRGPRRSAAAARIVDAVDAKWGPVDILVNNAGTSWGASAEDYPDEGWDKVLTLNVDAQFRMCREVGRRAMVPRRPRQDREHRVDRRPVRQSAGVGDTVGRVQHEQGRAHQPDARARGGMGPATTST